MLDNFTISIVIPVKDSLESLMETLKSIDWQTSTPLETIVVDDGSREPVKEVFLQTSPLKILRLPESRGPAVARNFGAETASGDVILFVDADVVLNPDVTSKIQEHFLTKPGLAAVQGSYTADTPVDRGLFSRYQNHYYYYVFESLSSTKPAICATFCYGILRSVFLQMGGFDTGILKPTVEDESFGYRMSDAGHAVVLDLKIQVMHMAQYTTVSFIRRKFNMSFHQIKSLFRGVKPPLSVDPDSNRTHHPVDTLAGVVLSPLLVMAIILSSPAFVLIMLMYFAANARFWRYLLKREPWVFGIEMCWITWLDQIVIFSGLLSGALDFLLKRSY